MGAEALAKFRRVIREFGMLKAKEHIAVALSGGKDSGALLLMLKKLKMPLRISAIFFHEGTGYRQKGLMIAKRMAEDLEIPLYVVRWPLTRPLGEFHRPCSICSLVKRRYLNEAARYIGADKLAVGHTAEDFAEAYILNAIRNEPERFFRSGPVQKSVDPRLVPRIKPLVYHTADETAAVMREHGYPVLPKACPYAQFSTRFKVRQMLKGIKSQVVNIARTHVYLSQLREQHFKLGTCELCGAPAAGKICSLCRLLRDELGDTYEPPGEVSRFIHQEV